MPESVVPIALVTGGNRGIGREVCRQLAQRGMIVILGARERQRARWLRRSWLRRDRMCAR